MDLFRNLRRKTIVQQSRISFLAPAANLCTTKDAEQTVIKRELRDVGAKLSKRLYPV